VKAVARPVVIGSALVLVLFGLAIAAEAPEVDVGLLSGLELETPKEAMENQYLGLSGKPAFSVPQIKAKVVLIEIFSMYCPVCQREAKKINEMFRAIENDPLLKSNVRMIGIGTGNTPYEVEVFRKKFAVPFPMISDEKFQVQKAFKEKIGTPTFLVLRTETGKTPTLAGVHTGPIEKPDEFLKTLR
jgi:peroxiredoxin